MDNERSGNAPLTGEHGAQTGFDTPDLKDDHQQAYTTTPAGDRVGSAGEGHAAEGHYEPVELPSAREVTGQFDHLATRDVAAMEHAQQDAEYAGAQTVAGPGSDALDGVVPSAGLGITAASAAALESGLTTPADQNPGYTPPSNQGPPHVSQRPGDLPQGEPSELEHEVMGDGERS